MTPEKKNTTVDEFLNPKSMVTPGLAGSLVMFITNTLCLQFPELRPRWIGILLSFIIGLLVFVAGEIPKWQRGIYYVLNSLVIFVVAMGTTYAGATATRSAQLLPNKFIVEHTNTRNMISMSMLISDAFADEKSVKEYNNEKSIELINRDIDRIDKDLKRQEYELQKMRNENKELRDRLNSSSGSRGNSGGGTESDFFKKW